MLAVTQKGTQTSQYIFLVGVLVVIAVMIWTSSTYLGQVQLPESQQQNLTGSHSQIVESLARLTDRCWNQASNGQSRQYLDCYIVSIDTDQAITRDQIGAGLQAMPEARLEMTTIQPDTDQVRITYQPSSQNITIG